MVDEKSNVGDTKAQTIAQAEALRKQRMEQAKANPKTIQEEPQNVPPSWTPPDGEIGKLPMGEHRIPDELLRKAESQPRPQISENFSQRKRQDRYNSELEKAFAYTIKKPPTYQLELPSRGLLYNGYVPNGMVNVTPLTAREEKLLSGVGEVTEIIDTIFERCVDTRGMRAEDFLASDRFYVLMMLRVNSYGAEYSFPITCELCNFDFAETINISEDLEVTRLEDDVEEPFHIILPWSQKEVGFHLLRGKEEAKITSYTRRVLGRRRQKRVAKLEGDPAFTYRVAIAIDTLDGIDVSGEDLIDRKVQFVESLVGADSDALQSAVANSDSGIDTEMDIRCPNCRRVNTIIMPFTAEFFRPSARRHG